MAAEHFDAVVVGAGPAGAAAALTLARAGLSVVLLDRGEFPGAKNMFGGVLYRHPLSQLFDGEAVWQENGFPVERVVTEQRYWLLGPQSSVSIGHRHLRFADPPNAWTAFRARFDPWLARKAEAAGALGVYQTTAVDLLRDGRGRVVGVRTDRDEGDLAADVVVIADGVNSLLRERLGVPRWQPHQVSLAVKEVLALPREKIEDRFNLEGNEGATIEFLGDTSRGMVGLGFLYTNRESVSLGIGVLVSDLMRQRLAPYELLESVKAHPILRRLLSGTESVEYSAHMIPEGAYDALPPALAGDGWVLCGDAAGLVNFMNREGTNLAMLSGRMAAQTIVEARRQGGLNADALMAYDRRLRRSLIGQDLRKIRRMPALLHRWGGRRLFGDLVAAANEAAYRYFLVDGTPKRQAESIALGELVKAAGGWRGMARLAWDGMRGIRG